MSPVHRCTHTHPDTVPVSSLVLQSRSTARSARSFRHNYCTFAAVLEPFSTCLISQLVNRLLDAHYMYVMKLRDIWSISVLYRRCGCALVCLPNVKTVLLQYLERSVFICYCADESESLNSNCVTFGWQFCGKKESSLILWKPYIRTALQTLATSHDTQTHVSWSLVTVIYETETRTATRSTWQVISQSVFLSTRAPFCKMYT